jgi:hypothetical protein
MEQTAMKIRLKFRSISVGHTVAMELLKMENFFPNERKNSM